MNYFSDKETTVTTSRTPNIPNEQQRANIEVARASMNRVREVVGPCSINSWFRSAAVNREKGGSPTSGHMLGFCVDFWSKGKTNKEICDIIDKAGIKYDQLIDEYDGSKYWVHISFDPRMRGQRMTARKINGKMHYRTVN